MRQSTANHLTEQIKRAIIGGDYPEGSQLKQDDIAKDFGVSKIPIREALVQLESEGFVKSYPGRGVFVSTLSAEDAQELYLLRTACEPILLEHSLKNADALMFARAESYLKALRTEGLSASELHAFDRDFHSSLYGGAELPRIQQLVRSAHDNLARYFSVYERLGQDFRTLSDEEHEALFDLSKAGDVKEARAVLIKHLNRSFSELSRALEKGK